jgi:hypothetical protein
MANLSRVFNQSVDDWSWNRNNPYYNPEKCGLELVDVLDVPELSWEYDTIILVKDKESGEYFMAHDSGCSCPTPFEEVRGLGDMTHIRSVEEFDSFIKSYSHSVTYQYPRADVTRARRKLRDRLNRRANHGQEVLA